MSANGQAGERTSHKHSPVETCGKYMTFEVGGEVYGIHIQVLQEIIRHQPPTELPGAPPEVLGVLRLRRRIVPVLCLRAHLGMIASGDDDRRCILVVRVDGRETGLLVDRVLEVVDVKADDVRPPPALACDVPADHLIGLVTTHGVTRRLLDVRAVLPSLPTYDEPIASTP